MMQLQRCVTITRQVHPRAKRRGRKRVANGEELSLLSRTRVHFTRNSEYLKGGKKGISHTPEVLRFERSPGVTSFSLTTISGLPLANVCSLRQCTTGRVVYTTMKHRLRNGRP
ncbi:uncharacterized protein LOC118647670 [Monomorium pharaonis]|uniref:uncharacterized protein LOC118647670 n=1 Tax=Monomorium pharaonis TaxID=307658 RepID=UPI001746A6AF|nr:uncharacterized protein LOC118647670 [Monomorium pharaonis]